MKLRPSFLRPAESAFTLVEIAICLAIIGVALVAIIGILPLGLNTQRDTREETIIAQDVATLLPMIAQGARGSDDLTNYVYAIANAGSKPDGYHGYYNPNPLFSAQVSLFEANFSDMTWSPSLTNGANIIGLLSTPEFTSNNVAFPFYTTDAVSNHIVARMLSFSGLATEKPPQNNDVMLGEAFSYQIYVVNASVAADTNTLINAYSTFSPFNHQLAASQRELRMTYYWPVLPTGKTGTYRQTFRSTIAGQLMPTNVYQGQWLYFYQPQSFAANTNIYLP